MYVCMLPMKQFSFSCHFISFLFIIFSHVQVHYTEKVDERSKTKALFRQYSDQVNMKANILSKITLKTTAAVLNNITSFKLFNVFFGNSIKLLMLRSFNGFFMKTYLDVSVFKILSILCEIFCS